MNAEVMNLELNKTPLPPVDFYRELCPELQAAAELRGPNEFAIYHALMHDPFGTLRLHFSPAELNAQLEEMKAIVQEHRNQRKWLRYIVAHTKPYRCQVLWEVRNE